MHYEQIFPAWIIEQENWVNNSIINLWHDKRTKLGIPSSLPTRPMTKSQG